MRVIICSCLGYPVYHHARIVTNVITSSYMNTSNVYSIYLLGNVLSGNV